MNDFEDSDRELMDVLRDTNLLPHLMNSAHDSSESALSRRKFLFLALAAAIAPQMTSAQAAGQTAQMPYRKLGKTGEKVSIIGLGGYHIGRQSSEEESIEIIRTAIDNGINFMDNSCHYNDGNSELRMGKALKNGYRDKVFLMTKIDGRDKKSATKQIDESLKRLQTDRLDLLQMHEVIRMSDARIFDPGGAIEGMLAAKEAGKVRYIGFTGHKSPEIHLNMLDSAKNHGFTFDAVQMPLNVMDAHYSSFEQLVLPVLVKEKIGVLGMKSMGFGTILKSNFVSAIECLHYALSLPTSVVITGCDSMSILQQALTAARTFKPFTPGERIALLNRTKQAAEHGKFEPYKTTHWFDSTVKHPEWMG